MIFQDPLLTVFYDRICNWHLQSKRLLQSKRKNKSSPSFRIYQPLCSQCQFQDCIYTMKAPFQHADFCQLSTYRTKCCNHSFLRYKLCPSLTPLLVFLQDEPWVCVFTYPWTFWIFCILFLTLPLTFRLLVHVPYLQHLPIITLPIQRIHLSLELNSAAVSSTLGTWLASSLFEAFRFPAASSYTPPCVYLQPPSFWFLHLSF